MQRQFHVRRYWLALATIMAAAAVAFAGPVVAMTKCKHVEGSFTLQSLDPNACPSPVGFCVEGTYRGDLKGTGRFTGSALTPTADTPTTSVLLATGDNEITTRQGMLRTKDAIVFETTGAGNFGEVDTIVGGSEAWAGASGTLRATGTFAGGSGAGTYQGTICMP